MSGFLASCPVCGGTDIEVCGCETVKDATLDVVHGRMAKSRSVDHGFVNLYGLCGGQSVLVKQARVCMTCGTVVPYLRHDVLSMLRTGEKHDV